MKIKTKLVIIHKKRKGRYDWYKSDTSSRQNDEKEIKLITIQHFYNQKKTIHKSVRNSHEMSNVKQYIQEN